MSRRIGISAALLVAILAAAGLGGPPAHAAEGIRLVGALPVVPPRESPADNPRLVLDGKARRAMLVYEAGAQVEIASFDLDRLTSAGRRRLPIRALRDLIVVDEERNRMLIPYFSPEFLGNIFSGIAVVDTRTLKQTATWPTPPLTDFLRSVQVAVPQLQPVLSGIGYYAPEGRFGPQKLLLLIQDAAVLLSGAVLVRNVVSIAQWDALSGEQDWVYQVNSCEFILNFFQTVIRSARTRSIYLGCATRQGGGVAVDVPLDEEGKPTGVERAIAGPLNLENMVSDPGGDRLMFGVFDDGRKSLMVYDGRRAAYVGVIAISKKQGSAFGVDGTSGRVYALTRDNGLILADARRTPAQQGVVFKDFAGNGVDRIVVDPKRGARPRRAFVRAEGNPFYWVIEDNVPISEDTPLSDLDRFTIDRPEEPGVTGRSFQASGHAYGVRTLIVGGAEGIPPPGPLALTRRAFRGAGSPCTRFDREIVAGLVPEVSLGESSTKAAAIAADGDVGTKLDGADPASRCWPIPDPLGSGFGQEVWPKPPPGTASSPWPFEKAECAGAGTVERTGYKEPTGAGRYFTGFRAVAACDPVKQSAEGVARSGFRLPGGEIGGVQVPEISVGDSTSRVTLALGEQGGVVAYAEAAARDLHILGVGTIDLVFARATARAAGRRDTAETSFERVVCGVVITTLIQPGCTDAKAVVAVLDRALGARGRARLPVPDQELADGTPGGYLASVQRDRTEELSGRVLNNDFSTQVPGLEIVFFNDEVEHGRARQVFQFAGVDVSTTYGIFLLGQEFVPPPEVVQTLGPLEEPRVIEVLSGSDRAAGPREVTRAKSVLERVRSGFSVYARSPGQALLATAVWLAIGLPVYLAVRRLRMLRAMRGK